MERNLNRPVSWEYYRAMPLGLRLEYTVYLIDHYYASSASMAQMFGINKAIFFRNMVKLGVDHLFEQRRTMTNEQKLEWLRFIEQDKTGASAPEEPEETEDTSPAAARFRYLIEGRFYPDGLITLASNISSMLPSDDEEYAVRISVQEI